MSAYGRNRGRGRIGYLAEFLIIIAGITVSFFLNDWRENKKEGEYKIKLLHEISSDLKTDSIMLTYAVDIYKTLLASHDSLLLDRNREISTDSLDIYVDHIVSYLPFQETQNTYLKMMNNPDLTITSEDSLLERFLIIHNQLYKMAGEWFYIEKDFVLNQMLPYIDQHAPFYYPPPMGKSFQGKVFNDLRKEDAFMNLIKSGRSYKFYISKIYEGSIQQITLFKSQLDAYLKDLEKED